MATYEVASPPVPEQRAISAFLHRETARIDALVAKKERLIELLQEKRTALITRAVTKGLDLNVPMKDSGVEWLGEIPAHWDVSHLKYLASRIVDCPHETPTYADDGDHFVIRTADVAEGELDLSYARRVDDVEFARRIRRLRVEAGDILYSREGERFGFAALVPDGDSVCLGQRMMQFRVRGEWFSRFVMWQLNAKFVYQQASLDTAGATSPHVNVETIRNYWMCGPGIEEQRAIATFLHRETACIDALVAKVREAIERLKEYRTALISAAVTGKIDMR
jgi:type I restriction enzyme S subunit